MKKVIKVIFFIFVALFLLIIFFASLDVSISQPAPDEFSTEDFDLIDTLAGDVRTTHHRVWQDADYSKRKMDYSFLASADNDSFHNRDTMTILEGGSEKMFWRNFYYGLFNHDKGALQSLQDSLLALAARENISPASLLFTTVSMIQDIRYNYIISTDSCASHIDFPCVPLQRYGILSPVEFLYSLSGDCDTRTVMLFTLLKNMGYDPIIVNSYQYRHSMLAVDVPTQGDYFIHKGRKFYFWETTSPGWMPGMLPPDMPNTDYWTIILDYEFQADPTRSY